MELWVEKYRPQKLEDYVGNEVIKNKIADYIKESSIQNLLFYGVAGTILITECTIVDDPEDDKEVDPMSMMGM